MRLDFLNEGPTERVEVTWIEGHKTPRQIVVDRPADIADIAAKIRSRGYHFELHDAGHALIAIRCVELASGAPITARLVEGDEHGISMREIALAFDDVVREAAAKIDLDEMSRSVSKFAAAFAGVGAGAKTALDAFEKFAGAVGKPGGYTPADSLASSMNHGAIGSEIRGKSYSVLVTDEIGPALPDHIRCRCVAEETKEVCPACGARGTGRHGYGICDKPKSERESLLPDFGNWERAKGFK